MRKTGTPGAAARSSSSVERQVDVVEEGADLPRPPLHVSRALAKDLQALKKAVELPVPDAVLVAALAAWTQLFGLVSFELFSQTRGAIAAHEDLLRSAATTMARHMGLAT